MAEYPQPDGFVKALFAGQIRQDLLVPYPQPDPTGPGSRASSDRPGEAGARKDRCAHH